MRKIQFNSYISKCEFKLLRFLLCRIFRNNKNITVISEFTVISGGQFLLGKSGSAWRKPPTFDRKTDNPSQLGLESRAPTQAGFELTTSVLTG